MDKRSKQHFHVKSEKAPRFVLLENAEPKTMIKSRDILVSRLN